MKHIKLAILLLVSALTQQGLMADKAVDKIIAKYIEASGGDAFENVTTTQLEGKVELVGMNIGGDCRILTKAPGKNRVLMNIGPMSTVAGCDGKQAWNCDPMLGIRELEGSENNYQVLSAKTDLLKNYKKYFKEVKLLGEEEFESKACQAVRFVPEGADPITYFFDIETSLVAGQKTVIDSAQGRMEVSIHLTDYREFEGLMLPFKTVMKMMGMSMEITLETVEINSELPNSLFRFPANLKPVVTMRGKNSFKLDGVNMSATALLAQVDALCSVGAEFKVPEIIIRNPRNLKGEAFDKLVESLKAKSIKLTIPE